MSKLLEAVIDIASKLDPDIDLGLEAEFGSDWQKKLSKELNNDDDLIKELKKKYKVKELKVIAKENDIKVSGNEEKIIRTLLEAGIEL